MESMSHAGRTQLHTLADRPWKRGDLRLRLVPRERSRLWIILACVVDLVEARGVDRPVSRCQWVGSVLLVRRRARAPTPVWDRHPVPRRPRPEQCADAAAAGRRE